MSRIFVAVELGTPKPLFDANLVGGFGIIIGFGSQYDVTPDGQRFLVNLESANSDSPLTVILNWKSALAKK